MSRRRATLKETEREQIARMERTRDEARAQLEERTNTMMGPQPESVMYAEEQAEHIIAEAKAKAEQIIQQAELEAEEKMAPRTCVCGKRFKNAAGLGSHRKTCKEYQHGLTTPGPVE